MASLLYKYHIVSTALLVWIIVMATWVLLRVFGENPPDISMGTATALGTVLGVPAVAIEFYRWRNSQKEGKDV